MQSWKEIIVYWIESNGDNSIVLLYIVSLAYLLIFGKQNRVRLALPAVIITIGILNPFTSSLVFPKLFYNGTSWRAFWMIPEVSVIAIAFSSVLKKITHKLIRPSVALFMCMAIMISGPVLYSDERFAFESCGNYRKIPQEAIDVVDTLLSFEDEPRVVMDSELMYYTREISGHVTQMYGRDAYGYIQQIGESEYQTFEQMNSGNPDFSIVSSNMRNLEFRYIVIPKDNYDSWHFAMENNKFVLIADVDGYLIYTLGV